MILRDLQAGDADGLSALFTRCYGPTYGTRLFYDVNQLSEAIATGALRSVVAVAADTETGSVVLGHTGITIRYPDALICETGNTVVDPDARGQGLLGKLGAALRDRTLREGFYGYVHYPTTAHAIMQKTSVTGGGHEVGVMLDYVPETTRYEHLKTQVGRIAATIVFQPFQDLPPRPAYLPQQYAGLLGQIYAQLGLTRETPTAAPPDLPPGHCTLQASRGIAHGFAAGENWALQLDTVITQHDPALCLMDLPLGQPDISDTVEALRGRGFIFSGLMPGFAACDVLRMQRIAAPTSTTFTPDLVNDVARQFSQTMADEQAGLDS